ncbi:glycosyltransferase family 2 protein [Allomuricauda sp. F6463D]|uniref:glycosyltransferase family 2 protein n=1 Tax=Allomuricauda sp. F6463D TaxID=2926409 RepID=UPI001FF2CE5B|nr:glycosyltransferase [Muricauda sp. F6463D]MCK0159305.1 glycosyltransferase [Muricauda sp. F6463D]
MKLSIIIPLYNKEEHIEHCLKSLFNQDLPSNEYEIIVVDDGSTDDSFTIVQRFAEKYSNIKLLRQQNIGPSAATNKGLELASGDYVYFLDADDYLASNVLGRLLDLAETNQLEVLGFRTKHTEDRILFDSSPDDLTIEVMDGLTFIAEHGYRNEACWYIIKKSFLLDTGIKFVEGRLMEDAIFTATLFLKTNRISRVNWSIHRFVQVKNSITTSKAPSHNLKFINDLVYAIENFDFLIKKLAPSHMNYHKVVKDLKYKQQSFVFTLFIKAFKGGVITDKDLQKILQKLKTINVYPINPKIGGIGSAKTSFFYKTTFVPVFNNKILLFLELKLNRLFYSR